MHEAPLGMPRLRPGIREHQEQPVEARVRQQPQQMPRILRPQAQVRRQRRRSPPRPPAPGATAASRCRSRRPRGDQPTRGSRSTCASACSPPPKPTSSHSASTGGAEGGARVGGLAASSRSRGRVASAVAAAAPAADGCGGGHRGGRARPRRGVDGGGHAKSWMNRAAACSAAPDGRSGDRYQRPKARFSAGTRSRCVPT